MRRRNGEDTFVQQIIENKTKTIMETKNNLTKQRAGGIVIEDETLG